MWHWVIPVCLGCGGKSLGRELCLWEHHQVSWEMQGLAQAFGMSLFLVTLVLPLEQFHSWRVQPRLGQHVKPTGAQAVWGNQEEQVPFLLVTL